jgi:hypothetical protein
MSALVDPDVTHADYSRVLIDDLRASTCMVWLVFGRRNLAIPRGFGVRLL